MIDQVTADKTWSRLWTRLDFVVAFFGIATIVILLLINLPGATDYVGVDNDDAMRLVQVRDLLGGQSWFDLTQYRLGLDGGTLMHWSRLVDLPIAALILAFSQVLPAERAEAAALLVWPLFLILPLFVAVAVGARRIGGLPAMPIALGLAALLALTSNRFLPGAIDHHNVQLVLVAVIAAMLVDPRHKPASFALAGLAAAVAIAIGAETSPFVATACLVVAVLWAWHGSGFAPAARAFALTVTIAISALFFATVPPRLYTMAACDSLSISYYGITAVGGLLLLVTVQLASHASRRTRFAVLMADGAAVLAAALILAPQCLQNPLNDLDPLLVTLWLDFVIEAQSILQQLRVEPASLGGFYAVGFFAIVVCLLRIVRDDRREIHAILLALILVSWLIALIQLRGAVFANLLSILPLSLLIAELRRNARDDPENMGAGFAFAVTTLLAVPSVWLLVGVFATEGTAGVTQRMKGSVGPATSSQDCEAAAALRQLGALPPTTVVAPSNTGSKILRFTAHRVLSAPYHRNQGGMLTELHIGLATPAEAAAFLRGAGATIIAYCGTDPQTETIRELKPDGFYAALERGEVPTYLEPLPRDPKSGLALYRMRF
ncbi:unnamed protein product [Ciceribacter sp. T2.26MG-112.2]|uniref:hypothetical protein n=1 Tax=Ciceribacter sp. T2.26MG-112.2 TaxID=3137154 RepID=UPI000E122170|nr:hypothetical protein [Ciceribacter naphthalenivorans]SSC70459.1 unnamed protein product [Ciceribacter naphthalenivorans]